MKQIQRILSLIIVVLILFSTVSISDAATVSAAAQSIEIRTAEQLNAVREDLNASYILMANIDLSSISNWVPIGFGTTPFTGTFDGNGYVISNVNVSLHYDAGNLQTESADAGLFGYTNGATIKNLGVENAKYTITSGDFSSTHYSNVGGIAGTIQNTSIENCYFKGSINNNLGKNIFSRSAGIAAIGISSNVTNCYSHSDIYASAYNMNTMAAGLVAWLDSVTIDKCYVAGNVVGENTTGPCYVGGANSSGNANSIFGIILSYGGTVKKCAILLENISANSGTNNYINDIGNFSDQYNNIVLSFDSPEAKLQSTYENLGWDFQSVWKIEDSYPILNVFNNQIEDNDDKADFEIGRDSNSFLHWASSDPNSGYYKVQNHYISDDAVRAKLMNLCTSNGELSSVLDKMYSTWKGSCYGISEVMGLCYLGLLSVNDITSYPTDNFYLLKRPCDNPKLFDTIEYYYLTQFLKNYGTTSNQCIQKAFNFINYSAPQTILNSYFDSDFYKLLIQEVNKKQMVLLGYGETDGSGHAIITCGLKQINENIYEIKLYDMNDMSDYDKLIITVKDGKYSAQYRCFRDPAKDFMNEITYMYYLPLNTLEEISPYAKSQLKGISKSSDDTMELILELKSAFEINFSNGKYLLFDGSRFDGNIEIYDVQYIAAEQAENDNAKVKLEVKYSDSLQYTPDNKTNITVYDDNRYYSVSGCNIDSVDISFQNGLNIVGDIFQFESSVNRNIDNTVEVVHCSGNATNDLQIKTNEDGQVLVSSNSAVKNFSTQLLTERDNNTIIENEHGINFVIGESTLESYEHAYENIVKNEYLKSAATCNSKAIYYKSCSICGEKSDEIFESGEFNGNNHIRGTYIKDQKEATCFEEGYTGDTYCSDCNAKIASGTVIDKNAHNPASVWSTDENYHWKDCQTVGCGNIIDKAAHTGGEATCTKKAICSVCGVEYGTVNVDKHKNTEIRNIVEATCTTDGCTGDTYCKDCGVKISDGAVIPAGHKLDKVDAKAATHEADGNIEYYICSVCSKLFKDADATVEIAEQDTVIAKGEHDYGDTYKTNAENHWKECGCENIIEKAAHVFGDWNVVKEATATEKGAKERVCSVCGYKAEESIPAIGTATEPKPTDPPVPSDKDQTTKPADTDKTPEESPKTGDTSNLALWIALMFVSAAGIGSMTVVGRKKRVK